MKKFAILFTACLSLSAATNSYAQQIKKCCGGSTVVPALAAQTIDTLSIDAYNAAPVLGVAASSDLPNVEYIISKKNTPVNSSANAPTASVIMGASVDGQFSPYWFKRYGIRFAVGDTLEVTAIGYDLNQIKVLGDSLLNGYTSNNLPCCNLADLAGATDFCGTVKGQGINSASDINGLDDVLTVFNAFLENRPTIDSIADILGIINGAGQFISPECGGTGAKDFLSFGMDLDAKHVIELTDFKHTVSVKALSNVTSFVVFPNPVSNGMVNVSYDVTEATALTVNLYNVLGRLVKTQDQNAAQQGTIQLNVSDIPVGVYSLELTDGTNSRVQKVVVR